MTKQRKKEKTVIGWAVYKRYWLFDLYGAEKGKYGILQSFALGAMPYKIFSTKRDAQEWRTDKSDIIRKVRIIPFGN